MWDKIVISKITKNLIVLKILNLAIKCSKFDRRLSLIKASLYLNCNLMVYFLTAARREMMTLNLMILDMTSLSTIKLSDLTLNPT